MDVYKRLRKSKRTNTSSASSSSGKNKRRHQQQDQHEEEVLELIILSAQQLKNVSWFHRQQPYAVARIESCSGAKRTCVDTADGSNPTWNAILSFTVDAQLLEKETALLTVDVYNRGLLWDNLVGTVRVLLSDLVAKERYFRGKCLTFMVMRPSGRRHGLLNIGVPPKSFNLINSFKEGNIAMAMQVKATEEELMLETETETDSVVEMDSVAGMDGMEATDISETYPVTETDSDST